MPNYLADSQPKAEVNFTVRNISPDNKTIRIFDYPILPGEQRDLMRIPGITEEDIKSSLLKGVLARKFILGELILLSNTAHFEVNPAQMDFLTSIGIFFENLSDEESLETPTLGGYSVTDNLTGQVLAQANTYYDISQWNVILAAQNMNLSLGNGHIQVIQPGWYTIMASFSVTGTKGNTFKVAVFINDVINNCRTQMTVSNQALDRSSSLTDMNYLKAGDIVNLKVSSENPGATFTILQGNFNMFMVK